MPRWGDRWAAATRRIAFPFALLAGWIALGTVGYVALEGYSPFDALYMTVITLSTVGYQEVRPLDATGRVFTMVLILGGLGSALYALGRLAQLVIEGELLDVYGRRRRMREIEALHDHYIVCGYGRTARPVVEGLQAEGVPFCVVERDPELERELRAIGAPYVLGDATDEETLREAGLGRAKGLLALLASDADNLYLTMSAKGVNPQARVLARAGDEKAEAKLRRVGADDVVLPYKMAGQRVIQAVTKPRVLAFLDSLAERRELHLGMEEVPVAAASPLDGPTLADARLRQRTGAIVVAIQRGDLMMFNPDPGERLRAGDVLLALGPQDDLRKLESLGRAR